MPAPSDTDARTDDRPAEGEDHARPAGDDDHARPAGDDDHARPTEDDDHARPAEDEDEDGVTVTPHEVSGEVDYGRLVERFGATPLTDEQRRRLPDHPTVRRDVFYAGRDLDRFLNAAAAGREHSVVTGIGPSGPMHVGHLAPFYLARAIQERTGATVYVPLSDDEKRFSKDLSFEAIGEYTRRNLRDLLAVGFDPERTRILVDTADADVVYPVASSLAPAITQSTVEAAYGRPDNVGLSFYPAVQATHLLLPQLVAGEHPTLVPVAVDQDPHVRVARDVAAKGRLPVSKPGDLLGKFFPSLSGPGKASSSGDAPAIYLDDDRETVARKVRDHAHTGGAVDAETHRREGGDPSVDVPFRYLQYFFESDDRRLAELERQYRAGELLSGELKEVAIDRVADFLAAHRDRRPPEGELREHLRPYRLTDAERGGALDRAGVPDAV